MDRVRSKYRESLINQHVDNIDINLPEKFEEHKLPEERKNLVKKLIALRIQKLFKLVE